MNSVNKIVLGSRKSILAKLQAYEVGSAITEKYHDIKIEYKIITSEGDHDQLKDLTTFDSVGIFTKTVTRQLLEGAIDCAIHSWKDLPTTGEPETEIIATLKRADVHDVLILNYDSLNKEHLTILTSSPRRDISIKEFLSWGLSWNPRSILIKPVRGNVDTRLAKLVEHKEGDGLILAKAGLERLLSASNKDEDYKSRIKQLLSKTIKILLPLSVVPTAPAQGALAIEILKKREDLVAVFKAINHEQTFASVIFERDFLKQKGGGCHSKLGACHIPHALGATLFAQFVVNKGDNCNSELLIRENSFINRNFIDLKNYKIQDRKLFSFKLSEIKTARVPLLNNNFIDVQDFGVFVAKGSALPDELKEKLKSRVVWVSGTATWKKLASQGIQVNGTFDSLGDKDPPDVHCLFPEIIYWQKLSNYSSKEIGWATSIHTYAIEFSDIPDLSGFNFFYWSSFSEFEACLRNNSSILNKFHSCGAGSTYENLVKIIPLDRLTIFLSHQDWFNYFSGKD